MLRFLYAMDVFKTSQKRLVFTGKFTRCFNLKSVFVCREYFKNVFEGGFEFSSSSSSCVEFLFTAIQPGCSEKGI